MADKDISESPVRELLRRFFITFLLGVVIYRLGVVVPIPGVDAGALRSIVTAGAESNDPLSAVLRYADMFNGGAIQNASIFGLGITPYISASIIFQLLTFSIPSLKALQKEGEGGRRKINQYTRYATLGICLVQSAIASYALYFYPASNGVTIVDQSQYAHWAMFTFQSMVVITTGSMLLLWLCEQITRFGIGNGVSVVIMIGILSYMPVVFAGMGNNLGNLLLIMVFCLLIIAAIVVVVQAVRRIGLEQQRRVQGNKVYGGAQTTLPLKLNQANVIPVIFASPVMMVMAIAAQKLAADGMIPGLDSMLAFGTPGHRYVYAGLIYAFTFFYIGITFDLFDLSNHFKQAGFFVRGIKPGKNTVDYIAGILKRITFVGAIFLAAIAIMPEVATTFLPVGNQVANTLLGGTGLLIIVGVMIDIMQKVSTFLLAQQYQGLGGGGGAAPTRKSGKRF